MLLDYRYLAGWLIRRQRDVALFTRAEARDYIGWFTAHATGHVPAGMRRTGSLDPIWRLKLALLLAKCGFSARQLLRRGELLLETYRQGG
jgi:hypothetical protein